VLMQEKPNWVLVYGDTDSTLAGALAAVKLHIPVAHVEAGLRSFNRRMPEEINRVLTDHAADLLFTPTDTATRNLANEGISGKRVQQVGDVMYDAALYYRNKAKRPPGIPFDNGFILSTIHRAENTDDSNRLGNIISALNDAAAQTPVVLPLHPRTRKFLHQWNLNAGNITIIEPVGYLEMIWLLDHCKLVVTDSGGLQKEAYFFRKPCITTRDETEWVELVESGWNVVVGANQDSIIAAFLTLKCPAERQERLYGDGQAARKLAKYLMNEGWKGYCSCVY